MLLYGLSTVYWINLFDNEMETTVLLILYRDASESLGYNLYVRIYIST